MAALPDLSENLINESQTWEEIREIKAMPVPMAQKRELKNQLQVGTLMVALLMAMPTCKRHAIEIRQVPWYSRIVIIPSEYEIFCYRRYEARACASEFDNKKYFFEAFRYFAVSRQDQILQTISETFLSSNDFT